jgi:hypothetical protein
MRIQESSVKLAASHEASSSRSKEIESEIGFRRLFQTLAEVPESKPADKETALRERVQKMLESLVEAIMAAMDGKACRKNLAAGDVPESLPVDSAQGRLARGAEIVWRTRASERVSESESTTVCGKGVVKTCDGREIAFDFNLAMQREYTSESLLEESGSVELRDPLVLSFDGKYCELTEERMAFDLDADGSAEWIPGLEAGSCFLVFDRNANGRADDGSELFGTKSGNGFADLARLDDDGNGWIDEGDAAFSQLALWSGDSFRSLSEQGVGALYTAAVDAPFSLKNTRNELLGQIRAAGVYLMENGPVGIMQQVDLSTSALPPGQQEPDERQQLSA